MFMGSDERGIRRNQKNQEGETDIKPESDITKMIFILDLVSKNKRISLKELSVLARDLERSEIAAFLDILWGGRYLGKKKQLNDYYYSVTSRGNRLMQREEEIAAKLNNLLAKMKPKPWERLFNIVQFVAEREEATFAEICKAAEKRFPIGSSRANMYKDLEQLRMKKYLTISKHSALQEDRYKVGKAGFQFLRKGSRARTLPGEESLRADFRAGSSESKEFWACIGEITVPWIILEGTGVFKYAKENIVARYVDLPLELPSDLEALVSRQKADLARREKETGGTIWDGKKYRLISFHSTRFPDSLTDEEIPGMYFEFGPTRYSTHLALEQQLDVPSMVYDSRGQPTTIRKKYLDPAWNPFRPNPLLSNSFGINILVICQDKNVILVLRNLTELEKGRGVYNLSIDEGMARPIDEEVPGVPSVFKCAQRGLHEELGVVIPPEDITFVSFGVDPLRHEYGLLGTTTVGLTSTEVVNYFKMRAKDRFEVERKPIKVPFDPRSVFRFMQENKPWTPWAIVGLFQILASHSGLDKTERAARSILTEDNLWA
jgi:hypothetical protein